MNLGTLEKADVHFAERFASGETEAHIIWKAASDLNPNVKAVAVE